MKKLNKVIPVIAISIITFCVLDIIKKEKTQVDVYIETSNPTNYYAVASAYLLLDGNTAERKERLDLDVIDYSLFTNYNDAQRQLVTLEQKHPFARFVVVELKLR